MSTFFSYSFGCRVNEAEKETFDKKLLEGGFIFDNKNPGFCLVNTCAVTQKAEREARNLIYKLRKRYPKTKIIITGCGATYWKKYGLEKDLPIDFLFENKEKNSLIDFIKSYFQKESHFSFSQVSSKKNSSRFLSSGRLLLKIQDGCQRFCRFCIVPYLRGLPKSEKISHLVKKINIISNEEKISEVILTAINTADFGYDTGESFIDLIENIIKKTNVPRISFGSIHPLTIDNQFINFYKTKLSLGRLVNFFHIPIQSGSNKILNLMNRGYKIEKINEKVKQLNKINPYLFLSTDIMVGYLGEEDKDFEKTYQFLKKSPFVKFHIFRFSKRKNTAAYQLVKGLKEPQEEVKRRRAKSLQELSEKKLFSFMKKNLGRTSSVLILEKRVGDFYQGLLDNQLITLVKSKNNLKVGEIYHVIIKDLQREFLIAYN